MFHCVKGHKTFTESLGPTEHQGECCLEMEISEMLLRVQDIYNFIFKVKKACIDLGESSESLDAGGGYARGVWESQCGGHGSEF